MFDTMSDVNRAVQGLFRTQKAWRDGESREAHMDLRRAVARHLRATGVMRLLCGGGYRGAAAYPTVANGHAEAIVPHESGAVLIRLEPGDEYSFAHWASVRPGELRTNSLLRAYLRVRSVDPDAEEKAFLARQASGQVG